MLISIFTITLQIVITGKIQLFLQIRTIDSLMLSSPAAACLLTGAILGSLYTHIHTPIHAHTHSNIMMQHSVYYSATPLTTVAVMLQAVRRIIGFFW